MSAEIIMCKFETPASGDLRATSGLVQASLKGSPSYGLAARFGRMIANDAAVLGGADLTWQPDVRRMKIGTG